MLILQFSLHGEAMGRLYEGLVCLAKFGDAVSLDVYPNQLTLTTLNSSRTAYAAISLDRNTFFSEYTFTDAGRSPGQKGFACQIYNKALQTAFKNKFQDHRGRVSTILRCDVSLLDGRQAQQSKIEVKILCRYGIAYKYDVPFEDTEVMHALFDRSSAADSWRISARILREYVDFFETKAEQLDMVAQESKHVFTSFTEKIQDNREVLKQPLETAVAVHIQDFEHHQVQQDVHLIISVRDFRAIVVHAETLRTVISARFSTPGKPLQFSYENFGIACQFTVMTSGESSSQAGASAVSHSASTSTAQPASITTSTTTTTAAPRSSTADMPPPPRHLTPRSQTMRPHRPSLKAQILLSNQSQHDVEPDSLFMPNSDDERHWGARNTREAELEETLGWDATGESINAAGQKTVRDTITRHRVDIVESRANVAEAGLDPTQRLSQLHGLFD